MSKHETVRLVATVEPAVKALRELVAEVWRAHSNPKDSNYNACEDDFEACQWCVETKAALDTIDAAIANPTIQDNG